MSDRINRDDIIRIIILIHILFLFTFCSLIVDKIDTDGDGSVSEDELVIWIRIVSRR